MLAGEIICRKALVVVGGDHLQEGLGGGGGDHLEEGLGGGGGDQNEGLLVGGQHDMALAYFWESTTRGKIVWWLRVDNGSYISGSRMLV